MTRSVRGVWWMVSAALFFAGILVCGRALGGRFGAFEIVVLQTAISTLLMVPWLVTGGFAKLRTRRPAVYGLRAVVAMLAMASMFVAVQTLPVADATALLFSTGLFTVLFAAIALREAVGVRRWFALAVGFAGALIIIRPGFAEFSWAMAVMMLGALMFGAANVFTRFLATTEDANAIVFYNYLLMGLLALPPALAEWRAPEWRDAPVLMVLGVVTLLAQQSFTRSFVFAPPAVVMPAYYLQLPFVAVIGFFAFDEVPDAWVWAGAAVICASTYYITRAGQRAATVSAGEE